MKRLILIIALSYFVSINSVAWSDTDKDGVPDIKDACGETPNGIFVDANGCGSANNLCLPLQSGGYYPKGCEASTIEPIYFEVGKSRINYEQLAELQKLTQYLQLHDVTLCVVGHADISGTSQLNYDLSSARAKTVEQVLVEDYGVPASRLNTVVMGSKEANSELDSALRAYNRRVEFIVE